MRCDFTDHGTPDESEVAIEIEDLVPHELVAETQRPVHDTALIQDDAVLHRTAASEARRAELLHVTHESECASRGDPAREVVVLRIEMEGLLANRRVRKIDSVFQHQAVRRHDANALLAVDHLDGLANAQHRDLHPKLANAGRIDQMQKRKCAPVDDRHFRAVDVDIEIGDPGGHHGGKQMLHRPHRDVVFPYGRRVVEGRRRRLQSGDAKSVEIIPDERDPAACDGRLEVDSCVDAGVETDAADADVRVDRFAFCVHVRLPLSRGSATHGRGHDLALSRALSATYVLKRPPLNNESCGVIESRVWCESHTLPSDRIAAEWRANDRTTTGLSLRPSSRSLSGSSSSSWFSCTSLVSTALSTGSGDGSAARTWRRLRSFSFSPPPPP